MINLKQTLKQQRDLAWLCSPKGTPVVEAYWPNLNYGFARVIKDYARYPLHVPLPVVLPHGVYYEDDSVFPGEAMAPVPGVLSYPEFRDDAYRRNSPKIVVPGASPFLYALELFGQRPPRAAAGTLFMPLHSTAAVDVDTDWEALPDALDALDERFKPVTVCIHWHDYELGRHKSFARRGYPVVAAGHLVDDEFLFRLIHLLSQHRYSSSNGVGSSTFYSVAMGVPHFRVGDPAHEVTPEDPTDAKLLVPSERGEHRLDDIRAAFATPVEDVTDEQKALVDYYLGAERLKSREGLADDLRAVAEAAGR